MTCVRVLYYDASDFCVLLYRVITATVDVAWITKLHFEAIAKGLFTHRNFPDMACENLSKCQRWVDTESDEREKVMNEIDPVFS